MNNLISVLKPISSDMGEVTANLKKRNREKTDILVAIAALYTLVAVICFNSANAVDLPSKLLLGHKDRINSIDFSPDGKKLASAGVGENIIRLWDVQSGTQIATLQGHGGTVTSVAFSRDGLLASASEDETIRLWNVDAEEEIRKFLGHRGQIFDIDFSPDGKLLASGGSDQLVKIWEVETGREIATLPGHDAPVFSVAFSPDGKLLAVGYGDGTIGLWDLVTKQQLRIYRGHTNYVWSLDFSPDGSKLISGSWDETIKIWDVMSDGENTGNVLANLDAFVLSVAFSPDGRLIAAGLQDSGKGNTIRIWNAQTGAQIKAFDTKSKYDIKFSPDGNKLAAAGSSDGDIKIWESQTNPPKLISPENEAFIQNQTVLLKWTQAINAAVYYELEIATDGDFSTVILPATFVASQNFEFKIGSEEGYWWRVRAGGFGKVGDWSQPSHFVTLPPLPSSCFVKIDPAIQKIKENEGASIYIKIENVGELAGFQLELKFDPKIIKILSITEEGRIFEEDKTALTPNIDNLNGLISNVVATKTSAGGFSGNGILLKVYFKAKGAGEGELKLQNVILVNTLLKAISNCQIISGSVIVEDSSNTWDVNNDGEVNVFDLVFVGQHLGENIEPIKPNPDVNGDGIVDTSDLVLIGLHFGEKYDKESNQGDSVPWSPDTPPPVPRSPAIGNTTYRSNNSNNEHLKGLNYSEYLPLLRKLYAIVNQDMGHPAYSENANSELLNLRNILSNLIQSAKFQTPLQNQLYQNYPNPFNPETWIPYQLSQDAYVIITIFNASGRTVRTFDIGRQPAGSYINKTQAVYWNGKNNFGETVASGIYFYAIRAGSFTAIRKMLVIR